MSSVHTVIKDLPTKSYDINVFCQNTLALFCKLLILFYSIVCIVHLATIKKKCCKLLMS